MIDQYRRHPTSVDLAPIGRETSIVAALRTQLAAKDNEIKTLKAKVHEHESTIALSTGNSIHAAPNRPAHHRRTLNYEEPGKHSAQVTTDHLAA